MDSIIFYQPLTSAPEPSSRSQKRLDWSQKTDPPATRNIYGSTKLGGAGKIYSLPLSQDSANEDSGKSFGRLTAINTPEHESSDDELPFLHKLLRAKKPEMHSVGSERGKEADTISGISSTARNSDFTAAMEKKLRKHPSKQPRVQELSQVRRSAASSSGAGASRDAAIILSDDDSDDSTVTGSADHPGHRSGENAPGLLVGSTHVPTESMVDVGQLDASAGAGCREDSQRGERAPELGPHVFEQQSDKHHGNHLEDADFPVGSRTDSSLDMLPGSPTEVATDNTSTSQNHNVHIPRHDVRTPSDQTSTSEDHVSEDKLNQSPVPKEETKSRATLEGGDDSGHSQSPKREGTDFVGRLPKEQRDQYAPLRNTLSLDWNRKTPQKKRSRPSQLPALPKDAPNSKRMRTQLEPRRTIQAAHHPPAVDPEDNQYLVDHLLEKRIRRSSGKLITQYLVRWLGYEEEEDSWVNEQDIDPELIKKYLVTV